MLQKQSTMKALQATVATTALALAIQAAVTTEATAQAAVFEVIHPDVTKGGVEIEALNGIDISGVEEGDERSAHELAVGYGWTSFWKSTIAIEVANPRGESAEVEGFELENLFILPWFNGADHKDEKGNAADGHDHHGEFTLGIFTALEIPEEGGISDGALEFGPVFEAELGPLEWVGNLLVEVPFEEGDPGLAYASQLVLPVHHAIGVGVENFGEFEGLFGDSEGEEHYVGPAVYFGYTLPNGHVIEPRAAVLFGLNDESSDAVLSLNIEYKF